MHATVQLNRKKNKKKIEMKMEIVRACKREKYCEKIFTNYAAVY